MAAEEKNTTGEDLPETTADRTAQDAAEAAAAPEVSREAAHEGTVGAADSDTEGRADDAEDPADDDAAEEEPAAPVLRFDPTDPFAVPEEVLSLLRAPQRPARRPRVEDEDVDGEDVDDEREDGEDAPAVARRRRRRRRGAVDMELAGGEDGDPENTVTRVRAPRPASTSADTVQGVKGSTRLEAKRQRRRDSRTGGRRRTVITEAEFLARRESVDRKMLVRQRDQRIQIAVLEDGVLAEHFVSHTTQDSMIGNVYLGKVQNVLPSMEAAFVDIGRGRNAVLYAGEVDWDAAQLDGRPKKIENALKSGDTVLVQVTKDPVGHKGARLTSQISLPGRYLVYVPGGSMTGISRKLPDVERSRLKKILKDHLPQDAGVIVRTAAEGTSEQELQNDINRLRVQWEGILEKASAGKVLAPELLSAEPDLTIKTVRDVFNEDFSAMLVQGEATWDGIEAYVTYVAPHLLDRLHHWVPEDHDGEDLYATHRVDEQLHKALERKVYLPSGGSLVIDRTEAMTVVDVNTGKFTGSGGNLEETVTKNNLEAAEEIVRQLRLRDIGGIIVIDFIDMVLESNRDLVLRRLVECLGRDRTKHQVAEVTSLGLVQMTRKRMGTGLVEVFSETCEHCAGRGIVIHDTPVERSKWVGEKGGDAEARRRGKRRRGSGGEDAGPETAADTPEETTEEERLRRQRAEAARAALQSIAKASGKAAEDAAPRPEASAPTGPEDGSQEDGPADAEPTAAVEETSAGEAGEEESGGRRRKRRGRRRGRGRGQDDAAAAADAIDEDAEQPEQDEAVVAAAEPEDAEPADEGRTRVEPDDAPSAEQAAAPEDDASAGGEPGAGETGAVETDTVESGRRTRRGRARGRGRADRDARPAVSEPPVEAADGAEEHDLRPAQQAPGVPPAAETAAEPATEARTGRRRRRATSDSVATAPRPAAVEPEQEPVAPAAPERQETTEQAGVISFGGEPVSVPRRRGPRRASSDGVGALTTGLGRIEQALDRRTATAPASAPVATAPASAPVAPVEAEPVASAPAAEPAAGPAPSAGTAPSSRPVRRRPRRAASSDGVQVQVVAASAERPAPARRFIAAAPAAPAAPAPAETGEAPVMLGVGVRAEDIVRGE